MSSAPSRFGAGKVAAGIFLSRVLGLVRERVFAHYFGNGPLADAWRASLRLPAVLQNLLGEGSLSASFIPIYVRLLEDGKEKEAGQVAGAVLGLLTCLAGGLALLGALGAPVLVSVLLPGMAGDPRAEVTVRLLRLLFPMMGVLAVSAWVLGVLNSHRRFFISYVAPVFWNLALIGTLVVGSLRFGLGEEDLLYALGWGALAGGFLQLLFQIPFVLPYLNHLVVSLNRRQRDVQEVIKNMVPVVAARGAVNLSSLLDTFLASFLGVGAIALLGYSLTLYILPVSLFGMSIAASELPELSRDEARGNEAVTARAARAVDQVLFWMIPSAVGYVFFGDVIMATVFETGQFGADDARAAGIVLGAYALGLPASGAGRVLSSTFFALKDTRTPARIAYLRIGTSAVIGAALMFPLDDFRIGHLGLGAAGLALGATAGAYVEFGLLLRSIRQRLGPLGLSLGRLGGMAGAVLLALGVGAAVEASLAPGHTLVVGLGTVGAFGSTYLGVGHVLGVSPLSGTKDPTAES